MASFFLHQETRFDPKCAFETEYRLNEWVNKWKNEWMNERKRSSKNINLEKHKEPETETKRKNASVYCLCGHLVWRGMTTYAQTHKHTNTKVHLRPFCYCSEIFKLLVSYCVVIVSTRHDWTNLVTDQLLTDLFIAWPCSLVVLCNSPNKTQMFPFSRPWGKHFFCHTRKQFVWCSGVPHSAFSPRKDCR